MNYQLCPVCNLNTTAHEEYQNICNRLNKDMNEVSYETDVLNVTPIVLYQNHGESYIKYLSDQQTSFSSWDCNDYQFGTICRLICPEHTLYRRLLSLMHSNMDIKYVIISKVGSIGQEDIFSLYFASQNPPYSLRALALVSGHKENSMVGLYFQEFSHNGVSILWSCSWVNQHSNK